MYPHQAHSFSGSDQHITRYVVARAYKAQNSSSFPPVTAAAAHALAGRAVRPVSHTQSQSPRHQNWCRAARGRQKSSGPDGIAARKGCSQQSQKTNFEFSKAACNECAPLRRAGYKIAQNERRARTTHASDPRAGILSAK